MTAVGSSRYITENLTLGGKDIGVCGGASKGGRECVHSKKKTVRQSK